MYIKVQLYSLILYFLKEHSDAQTATTSEKNEQIENISECVLKLSSKYFVDKKALSGSIVIININSYTSNTQHILLKTIHRGIKYSIMVKDSHYPHANASHFPEKAKNYMLILEEKSELTRNILQLNKLPTWNPHAKAVVYYEKQSGDNERIVSMSFINELRQFKLLKTIILIYLPEKQEVVSFTWSPYSETNCGGECSTVYVLDKCKDGELQQQEQQRELFPSNLQGCPLVVYAVVSEPYVMPPTAKLSDSEYDDAYSFNAGGEINLVKIISQFTNMSLIVRMSSTPEDWGVIYSDGSATGALSILRNDSADLLIGNIEVTRTRRKWFDPTVSYTQDEITWCVPRAGRASTWNNLVIIFQWSTWVATLISLILMGLLFHYFYFKERDGKVTKWPTISLLMAFGILLGWGAKFQPKSAAFKILIFVWLCFSVNMGISYGSFLRSFLMHPRFEKQISTEPEIIQSGIRFGGREIYRAHFKSNNASSYYLYRKYSSTPFAQGIRRTALNRDFAVVSSKHQAIYQDQILGNGAKAVYCFDEGNNLYKYGVVVLTRKYFPILDKLNKIIRSVSENGLIEKWNEELLIRMRFGYDATHVVPLNIQHLIGAFMLIGIMYAASVLIFFGEILCHRIEKFRKKKIKYKF